MADEGALASLIAVARALEAAGARFMVGGSFASSLQGIPRSTQDVDLVAELTVRQGATFASTLGKEFHLDQERIHDGIQKRTSFDVIDLRNGFKVDIHLTNDDPFGRAQLEHRQSIEIRPDLTLAFATAEDVVLQKLRCYRMGGETSERQWLDALGVLKVQGSRIAHAGARMTLSPGSRLGPYEILAPLGAGGMGEVYRAKDTRLGREVAIKVLPAEVARDPERRRRFDQEARAVSSLSHPGIVTLFEIESAATPGGPIDFLAMELVPGEPQQRRIPAGGLPVAEAIDLALQAAEALAAAHAAGVVHRDLKPANLMVTTSGRLKVLDFGLARFQPTSLSDPEAATFAESSLTRAGSILGTLGYLAPEQAAGERADARSALFSLGVVLYEMLSGVSPFARDAPMRSLAAVLHEPAPAPAGVRNLGLGAVAAALVLAAASGIVWWRGADERWLTHQALPEIERLLVEDRRFAAYAVALDAARRARRRSPAAAHERDRARDSRLARSLVGPGGLPMTMTPGARLAQLPQFRGSDRRKVSEPPGTAQSLTSMLSRTSLPGGLVQKLALPLRLLPRADERRPAGPHQPKLVTAHRSILSSSARQRALGPTVPGGGPISPAWRASGTPAGRGGPAP